MQQIHNNKYKYKLLEEFQEFHADYFYYIAHLFATGIALSGLSVFFHAEMTKEMESPSSSEPKSLIPGPKW
jgi:hypothetical protein